MLVKMRYQHFQPTSITIGCIVQAVATHGDADGGYDLIIGLLVIVFYMDQATL